MSTTSSDQRLTDLSVWVLRIVLAARAIGLGCSYLWHPMERESDIYGTLYFEWGWQEATALLVENAGMWLMAIGGVALLLIHVLWRNQPSILRKFRGPEIALLLFCVVWELCIAAGLTLRGGQFLSQWTIGSHGLRMAVPLCLLMHAAGMRTVAITRVLHIAVASTFLIHGVKAWLGSPNFTTMIITGSQNVLNYDMPQSIVENILKVIGAVDVIVAGLILSVRSRNLLRYLLLWMAIWGLVTAVGRTLGASMAAYPETLLRLVHLGGPLVLFLEWSRPSDSMNDPKPQPTSEPAPICDQATAS